MNRFTGLLILGLVACDGSRPGGGRTDSESHWLESCASDAECGALACICGMCARACSAGGGECTGLGEDAACLALPAACGAVQACTRACDRAEQCGDLTCEGGACSPSAARPDGGPDATISVDMASFDMARPDMGRALPVTRLPDGPGCLADADCPGGRCQADGRDAQDQHCGAPASVVNVCQPEVCSQDADCGLARRCVRAGEFGHVRSACVPARCVGDADCIDRPAGECLGFFTPCHVGGFGCVGEGDACRVDTDCPQRGAARVCLPRAGGGTECVAIE